MPSTWRPAGRAAARSRARDRRRHWRRDAHLAAALPESVAIVATDLNQAMLDQARAARHRAPGRVAPGRCHATALRATRSFDAVVCQFGAMFFPDKAEGVCRGAPRARAGRRVPVQCLGPDRGKRVRRHRDDALAIVFPDDPPRFMARTPHGYHDRATIARRSEQGGLRVAPRIETVAARSRAASARIVADRLLPGHAAAQRNRGPRRRAARRGRPTRAAQAIARRFGRAPSTARSRRTWSASRPRADGFEMSRIAGIDVGGTFTDLILVDDDSGEVRIAKVPTTVANQADGVLAALDAARRRSARARSHRSWHHDHHQCDARAQDRHGRPDHDARLSRRARARPPDPADAVRPEGPLRAADRARFAPRGRRAHRRRRRGPRAARRGAGRGSGQAACSRSAPRASSSTSCTATSIRCTRRAPPRSPARSGRTATSRPGTTSSPNFASTSAARPPPSTPRCSPCCIATSSGCRPSCAARGFARELLVMQGNGGTVSSRIVAEHAGRTP